MTHDRELRISVAGSRKATLWRQESILWSALIERLKSPAMGAEGLSEYLRMPKGRQDELKDVGGFVGGSLAGGRRKPACVTGRDLIALDFDNIPGGETEAVLARIAALGCASAVYSTRKHEQQRPRLRALLPLKETLTADEYEPVARHCAERIGMALCDPTTFQVSRLMYWPSCCAGAQYVFRCTDAPLLDGRALLESYENWRDARSWPQVPGVQAAEGQLAAKQGDPTGKPGIVGAFCRSYDIYAAMDEFLPGVYLPVSGMEDRYSYAGGSTAAGAIVYGGGAFLYSHHATDPAGGRLCNSFDLVRLHRFGEMDAETKEGTPTTRLPSYAAMLALAREGEAGRRLQRERYEGALDALQGAVGAPEEETDTDWLAQLERLGDGYAATIGNVRLIMEHDPRIAGCVALEVFSGRMLRMREVPWSGEGHRGQPTKEGAQRQDAGRSCDAATAVGQPTKGGSAEGATSPSRIENSQGVAATVPQGRGQPTTEWTDLDDAGLRWYVEQAYGLRGARDRILDATELCAKSCAFDELRDYLDGLTWDGVPRLEALLSDYLGAEDDEYTRGVTRKAFVAAVARAYEPGIKYDTMLILQGEQGCGKSTLLRVMGGKWFLDCVGDLSNKDSYELLQGRWIIEMAELASLNRSERNITKQFLSRQEDSFRPAYARRSVKRPRRCVFFGSTNEEEYLQDDTGNRRFWPVRVRAAEPKRDVFTQLQEERDQLWAEAVYLYRQGEPLHLEGALLMQARRQQEAREIGDEREGLVREFLRRPVAENWLSMSIAERRAWWNLGAKTGEARDRVCAAEVWVECLGGDLKYLGRKETIAINRMLDRIEGLERREKSGMSFGPYGGKDGKRRGYWVRDGDEI